ncbi:hypothetical protein ER308_18815 [Egibacter rhizosphaerae]|uniref:NlpC/P60 domain-containing protein n=1 Tax=Egibacter rhizosphaerae TaxID=1670831 RepID=A0A411YJP3_9ACTN|nr:C40 family peptidase [Egibacter rhizosphaerae]QBI21416.1 hypothetical protein ER308_18815 [Egibacter rhizosphaerae]
MLAGAAGALVLGLAVALSAPVALADPATLDEIDEQREELEAEREAREAERDELDRERTEAEERLAELDEAASREVEAYRAAQAERDELESRVAEAQESVRQARAAVTAQQDRAAEIVRARYKGEQAASFASLLGSDPRDVARQSGYLSGLQRGRRADIEELAATQAVLEAERERLVAAEAAADEAVAQVEARREAVEERFAAQEEELEELRAAVAGAEDQLAATEEDLQAAEARREEAERAAEEARQAEMAETAAQVEAEDEDGGGAPAEPDGPDEADESEAAGSGDSDGSGGDQAQDGAGEPAGSGAAQVAVDTALAQQGTPYQWGGNGPDTFDCSGLTSYAWRAAGVEIPRTSQAQHDGLPNVSRDQLRPGDLVFFGNPIHHVGLYIGGGQMVEAPYSGQVVRTRSIDRSDYVGAARPGG